MKPFDTLAPGGVTTRALKPFEIAPPTASFARGTGRSVRPSFEITPSDQVAMAGLANAAKRPKAYEIMPPPGAATRGLKSGGCGCGGECGPCGVDGASVAFAPSSARFSLSESIPTGLPRIAPARLTSPRYAGSGTTPPTTAWPVLPGCDLLREEIKRLRNAHELTYKVLLDLNDELDRVRSGRAGEILLNEGEPCSWISDETQRLQTSEGISNPPPAGYNSRLRRLNDAYEDCTGGGDATEGERARAAEFAFDLQVQFLGRQIRATQRFMDLIFGRLLDAEERYRRSGCVGAPWFP